MFVHLCEMVNSLYVLAELDGLVQERNKISTMSNVNRKKEELKAMVDCIFELYDRF